MAEESDMDETTTDATDKDWQAEAEKWKNLARKHEEQAKGNSAAARRLAEIEAANKTQAEKDAEERTALARERDDARLELLRRDAADEAGLPRSWAARLRGSTKEELEADAKQLAKELAPEAKQTTPRPVADLKPGALPGSTSAALSPSAAIDAAIRRQARRGN